MEADIAWRSVSARLTPSLASGLIVLLTERALVVPKDSEILCRQTNRVVFALHKQPIQPLQPPRLGKAAKRPLSFLRRV